MTQADTDAGDPDDSGAGMTTVYDLDPRCTLSAVERGDLYHATVNGVVEYGVFVDVSKNVSGLVHESNLLGNYGVGDKLIVELADQKDDGDLSFAERRPPEYRTEAVAFSDQIGINELEDAVGDSVYIEGEVVQIKQTGGPTIFHVRDETGVVPCAAFEEAGVRAYPSIDVGDLVRVSGRAESHDGSVQIEVDSFDTVIGDNAERLGDRLETALQEASEPHDVEPLIEWDALDPLLDDLEDVARLLRQAVLEGRPIRMRHHADGDGICASVPLERALERFIEETHESDGAAQHMLKRLPSKAPFYEMEDVTRDLNFALENRDRHGQKLPLVLMLDNGSTEEDTPAYRNLAHYDIPIVVIDHHHPDPEAVEPLVEQHVNPYLYDEDYRITTGMLCVELARMIDPSLTDDLTHVPAVAGLSDRSEADAMADYLELAAEAGYDQADLRDVGEALDYATYWLKYDDGGQLIQDALNVACDDRERHEELVEFLATRSERDIDRQLEAAMAHVEHDQLDNGAHLYQIDVDQYARRFTYPAPGKTTGAIHDRKVEQTGDPVITIGYGPDFAVLRSDGVRLDIPEMVVELREELDGGVSGGGHLVVGSIKFVKGMREAVLDALVGKMAEAEIDEDLHSSVSLPHDQD